MNKALETAKIEKEQVGGDALLWVVVESESVREREMGRNGTRWRVWALPQRVAGGTNKSRGLRDNLWEGKWELVICLDLRHCWARSITPSAVLVSPHCPTADTQLLSWEQQHPLTSTRLHCAAHRHKLLIKISWVHLLLLHLLSGLLSEQSLTGNVCLNWTL